MQFQSQRLYFREFQPDDYHLFSSIFSNDDIMQYAYMNSITDESAMRKYYDEVLQEKVTQEKRRAYEFAVFHPDGDFVGIADFDVKYQDDQIKYAEIGYFLLPAFWGSGYATEIAKKLIDICFSELKIHKVVATCNANNLASERVMQKVGMVKEGHHREERYKNGRWDDELRYAVLEREWKERQA